MAKTDLYNERKREGRREEGVKGRKIERDRLFYDRAGLCRYCGAAFLYSRAFISVKQTTQTSLNML